MYNRLSFAQKVVHRVLYPGIILRSLCKGKLIEKEEATGTATTEVNDITPRLVKTLQEILLARMTVHRVLYLNIVTEGLVEGENSIVRQIIIYRNVQFILSQPCYLCTPPKLPFNDLKTMVALCFIGQQNNFRSIVTFIQQIS